MWFALKFIKIIWILLFCKAVEHVLIPSSYKIIKITGFVDYVHRPAF
jgi:hypothetical protein